MDLDLERFAFSESVDEDEIPSPQNLVLDEEVVEELLSSKLMNGFMLLDQPCPKCMIPLVKQPIPDSVLEEICQHTTTNNDAEEPTTPRIVTQLSMDNVPKPVRGIPYCVACENFVITNEQETQLLDLLKFSGDNYSLADTYNSLDTRALIELNASNADDRTKASSYAGEWITRNNSNYTNGSGILFKNTWSNKWKRDDASTMSLTSDKKLGQKLSKKILGMAASQDAGVEMKLEGRDDNDSAAFWKEVEQSAAARQPPTTPRCEPPNTPRCILSRPSIRMEFGLSEGGGGQDGVILNHDEIEETLTDLGVLSKEEYAGQESDTVEINENSPGEFEVQSPTKQSTKDLSADQENKWGKQLLNLAKNNTADTEPEFEETTTRTAGDRESEKEELEKREVEMLMNMASSSVSGEVAAALGKIEETALAIQGRQYQEDSTDTPENLLAEEKEESPDDEYSDHDYNSWRKDSFSQGAHVSTSKSASSGGDDSMEEYTMRREIATKVLGARMLQGYTLKETQCDQCGMPKMEYQSINLCVVCPVLAKKAKKERDRMNNKKSTNDIIPEEDGVMDFIDHYFEEKQKTSNSKKSKKSSATKDGKAEKKSSKKKTEEAHVKKRYEEAKEAKNLRKKQGQEPKATVKNQESKATNKKPKKRLGDFSDCDSICVASAAPDNIKAADARRKELDAKEKKLFAAAKAAKEGDKNSEDLKGGLTKDEQDRRKEESFRAEEIRNDQLRLIKETRRLETMERMRLANEIEFQSPQESTLAIYALQEERSRLRKEALRQKEIRALEEVRQEAALEARRIADEKRAAQEAEMIDVLEREAQRKAKEAEGAIAKAKAAMDEVSSAKKGFIANTIAQGEADTIAETEAIVRAEAEDYHEEAVLPSASFLWRERWETLRLEGRSVMTRRLIAGWTMLPEYCSGTECQSSPLLQRGGKMECVVCGGSGTGRDGAYAAPLIDEEDDNDFLDSLRRQGTSATVDHRTISTNNAVADAESRDPTNNTVQAVQQIHEDFEQKRQMVSKEIGKRMLQGWTLLDMSCPNCVMPLLADEDGENKICVLCGVLGKLDEDHETPEESQKGKASSNGSGETDLKIADKPRYDLYAGNTELKGHLVDMALKTSGRLMENTNMVPARRRPEKDEKALVKTSGLAELIQCRPNAEAMKFDDICDHGNDVSATNGTASFATFEHAIPRTIEAAKVTAKSRQDPSTSYDAEDTSYEESGERNKSSLKEFPKERPEQELYASCSDCPTDELAATSMVPISDFVVEPEEGAAQTAAGQPRQSKATGLALEKINARRGPHGKTPLTKDVSNIKSSRQTATAKSGNDTRSFSANARSRGLKKGLTIDTSAINNTGPPSPEKTIKTPMTPKTRGSGRRSPMSSPVFSPLEKRRKAASPVAANYDALAARLRSLLSDSKSPKKMTQTTRTVSSAPSSPRRASQEVPDYLISAIAGKQQSSNVAGKPRHEDPPAMTSEAVGRRARDPEDRSQVSSPRIMSSPQLTSPRGASSPQKQPFILSGSPRSAASPSASSSPRSFHFPESPSSRIRRSFDENEGVTLIIPNDFDVTDDAQLRELILAAKIQRGHTPAFIQGKIVQEDGVTTEIIDLIDIDDQQESKEPKRFIARRSRRDLPAEDQIDFVDLSNAELFEENNTNNEEILSTDTSKSSSTRRPRRSVLNIKTEKEAHVPSKAFGHAPSPGEAEAKRPTSFLSSPHQGNSIVVEAMHPPSPGEDGASGRHFAESPQHTVKSSISRKVRPMPEAMLNRSRHGPKPRSSMNETPRRISSVEKKSKPERTSQARDSVTGSSLNQSTFEPEQFYDSGESNNSPTANLGKIYFSHSSGSSHHGGHRAAGDASSLAESSMTMSMGTKEGAAGGLPPRSPRKKGSKSEQDSFSFRNGSSNTDSGYRKGNRDSESAAVYSSSSTTNVGDRNSVGENTLDTKEDNDVLFTATAKIASAHGGKQNKKSSKSRDGSDNVVIETGSTGGFEIKANSSSSGSSNRTSSQQSQSGGLLMFSSSGLSSPSRKNKTDDDEGSVHSASFEDIINRIDSCKEKLGKSSSSSEKDKPRSSSMNLELIGKFTAAAADVVIDDDSTEHEAD